MGLRTQVTKKLEEKELVHKDIKKLNNRKEYLNDNRSDEKAEIEKTEIQ